MRRIPISLIRRSAVKVDNPINPRQAKNAAREEKATNILENCRSAAYIRSSRSSINVKAKG